MGTQICSASFYPGSSRDEPSRLTNEGHMSSWGDPTDDTDMLQQFDNPSRGIIDHSFLKTAVTASNCKLNQITHPIVERQPSLDLAIVQEFESSENSEQPPSVYRIDSSQVSVGKDQWAEMVNFDTGSINVEDQIAEETLQRPRKSSVEAMLEQHNKEETEDFRDILKSVSEFVLTEKNVFEPLTVNKSDFVRIKKQSVEKYYKFVEKIGQGSYGNVYKAIHKVTHQLRAIKILKKSVVSTLQQAKIMKEIEILKKLDHPHIVKVYQVFFYQSTYYIVSEYCEGGALSYHLKHNSSPPPELIGSIFIQLISAISYLHNMNILHRDIKLDNILLVKKIQNNKNSDVDIRIIDFGLSKEIKMKRVRDKEKIGTYTYMAPEVIDGVYSAKCDLWSAGIVLINLLTGRNPFKGKSKEETFDRIKKQSINFSTEKWKSISPEIKQVVAGLLEKDLRVRFSSQQVLASRWMCSVRSQEKQCSNVSRVANRIYNFYRGNNFVSIIESYLAYTTSAEQQIRQISRIFSALDQNNNGFIEREELENAFLTSSKTFSEEQIRYVLRKIQIQHSDRINYTQFVTILSDRTKLFAKQSLIQAFGYLDENSNGFIERSELKKALKGLPCNQLNHLIDQLDQNQDDRISLEEFINYLKKDTYHY